MTYALFIDYTLLIAFIGTKFCRFLEQRQQRRVIVAVKRIRQKYWQAKSEMRNN